MNLVVSDRADVPPPGETPRADEILLVTGMSGAGKSSALKALEDLGYEAVDNLPLSLVDKVMATGGNDGSRRDALAIAVDVRTRDFGVPAFLAAAVRLRGTPGARLRILFLDCDDETLRQRYTETRRRHPMDGHHTLLEAIRAERALMLPIAAEADRVLDSTQLTTADLRRVMAGEFGLDNRGGMAVTVMSFSFRRGPPREADLVFDVRFLRNPHYVPAMRDRTGLDPDVGTYVEADPAFQPFYDQLVQMMRLLLPRYRAEGKSYLTIAFGCTGGQHRSVYLAERLARTLADDGQRTALAHREIGRA